MEEQLKNDSYIILGKLYLLVEAIKEGGFQNNQWALNWIDEINKLSVEF